MLPISVSFSVKNSKHHKTFKIPFSTSSTIVCVGMVPLFCQIISTTPNARYTIVHTIGIRIFGTHSLVFAKLSYHGIPRRTNTLPSPATITIGIMMYNDFKNLFLLMLYIMTKSFDLLQKNKSLAKKKSATALFGAGGGIWTLDTLRYTGFRDQHIRPLWHPCTSKSKFLLTRLSSCHFLLGFSLMVTLSKGTFTLAYNKYIGIIQYNCKTIKWKIECTICQAIFLQKNIYML